VSWRTTQTTALDAIGDAVQYVNSLPMTMTIDIDVHVRAEAEAQIDVSKRESRRLYEGTFLVLTWGSI
jgi:hypothetical protein